MIALLVLAFGLPLWAVYTVFVATALLLPAVFLRAQRRERAGLSTG